MTIKQECLKHMSDLDDPMFLPGITDAFEGMVSSLLALSGSDLEYIPWLNFGSFKGWDEYLSDGWWKFFRYISGQGIDLFDLGFIDYDEDGTPIEQPLRPTLNALNTDPESIGHLTPVLKPNPRCLQMLEEERDQ